ncbi:MAG: alpha-amylase family protein [Planctomycetota bacterium]
MQLQPLRYRQVHLDFHTSPDIEGIGESFDKQAWQDTLRLGHVDSITLFSKCHHGWSYHPTKVGQTHPQLSFDLLRAQYDACKEIGVNAPIYLSAGYDEAAADLHADWQVQHVDGPSRPPLEPGYRKLCFNSPYLELLCAQIREVVEQFPDCDGIFLDIIRRRACVCPHCLAWMHERGLDARREQDVLACSIAALERYYEMTTAASQTGRDSMPVFHNNGHIERGRPDFYDRFFTHLELESLPTGGWGYDHFPLTAKYCEKLPHDFLGMTGKFHTSWGEVGGYKHPNALRYECAAMMANGSKCSIGDQLHPGGTLDSSTYRLIGQAYAEVETKEPWCDDTANVAEVAVLSSAAVGDDLINRAISDLPDVGASRILLEGHLLFGVIDQFMDFTPYRLLILPDDVAINTSLQAKLNDYLAQGGKLLLTGTSGFAQDGSGPVFDLGAQWLGQSEFGTDYLLPEPALRPDWIDQPVVMYAPSQRIKPTQGRSLGEVFDPYFNRDYRHFSSHQHAPHRPEPSGYTCGVQHGPITYLVHPVFRIYRGWGAVAYKDFVLRVIRSILGEPQITTNLPSTARLTLRDQPKENRSILHLLYANTVSRGGEMHLDGGTVSGRTTVEVIDDLVSLHGVEIDLDPGHPVAAVKLQPQSTPLEFTTHGERIRFTVPELRCHQMIELAWA